MSEHVGSVRTYIGVWLALLVLTVVTALVAEIDLGPWNIVVAMTIAVTKAMLVVLFFMHVKGSTHLTRLFVVAGFFWMAILFVMMFTDYASRTFQPRGWWW